MIGNRRVVRRSRVRRPAGHSDRHDVNGRCAWSDNRSPAAGSWDGDTVPLCRSIVSVTPYAGRLHGGLDVPEVTGHGEPGRWVAVQSRRGAGCLLPERGSRLRRAVQSRTWWGPRGMIIVRLLGPPRVEVDERNVELPPRALGVLSRLALDGGWVSAENLLMGLWGDDVDPVRRRSLQTLIASSTLTQARCGVH